MPPNVDNENIQASSPYLTPPQGPPPAPTDLRQTITTTRTPTSFVAPNTSEPFQPMDQMQTNPYLSPSAMRQPSYVSRPATQDQLQTNPYVSPSEMRPPYVGQSIAQDQMQPNPYISPSVMRSSYVGQSIAQDQMQPNPYASPSGMRPSYVSQAALPRTSFPRQSTIAVQPQFSRQASIAVQPSSNFPTQSTFSGPTAKSTDQSNVHFGGLYGSQQPSIVEPYFESYRQPSTTQQIAPSASRSPSRLQHEVMNPVNFNEGRETRTSSGFGIVVPQSQLYTADQQPVRGPSLIHRPSGLPVMIDQETSVQVERLGQRNPSIVRQVSGMSQTRQPTGSTVQQLRAPSRVSTLSRRSNISGSYAPSMSGQSAYSVVSRRSYTPNDEIFDVDMNPTNDTMSQGPVPALVGTETFVPTSTITIQAPRVSTASQRTISTCTLDNGRRPSKRNSIGAQVLPESAGAEQEFYKTNNNDPF